jgi:hypothetical protein
MDLLQQYLDSSKEIIGERSADEEKYDREIIRWLRKGKNIKKAIERANIKFPESALDVDDSALSDVQAHYEYLAEHENIMGKMRGN